MIFVPTSQALRGAILIGCAVLFSGCVQVGPKEFEIPSVAAVEHPVAAPESCRDPAVMPPIPSVVHVTIEPDQPVIADAGGEALLRAYVTHREWMKRCAH